MSDFSRVLIIFDFLLFCAIFGNNDGTYHGILTTNCVNHYYQIFVSRVIPPRNYLYFHETLLPPLQVDLVTDEAPVDVQFRIVGGEQVSITEVPYQALYGFYCGAIIIAPDWVLTAGHCTEKENFVLAGATRRSQTNRYSVCAHFTHPLYNKTNLHSHDFDYQLLLLEEPIPVTAKSRPIAIGNVQDVRPGVVVAVSGWGHTQYKQRAMQDVVRRVYVPIMDSDVCKSFPLSNYKSITPRMFCAGFVNGTKDSCQGDSGGPVESNGMLLGLVSFGVGCAMKDQPGVYSNVPMARGWIRQVTGLPL